MNKTAVVSSLMLAWLAAAVSVAEAEALPRVLILCDASCRPAANAAAKALKDRAEVVSKQPGDSGSALGRLDELLDEQPWDVILFNFGLADLTYRDPRTKAMRAMSKFAGGVRVSTSEQYAENLGGLVQRLERTGAKLVWASTLPIVKAKPDDLFDEGSEIEYNAIAAKIMAAHGVAIADLHRHVMENVKDPSKMPDPLGIHRSVPLDPPLVESIRRQLER